MRILFISSTSKAGRGGHIHSLDHISRAISEIHTVKVATIGPSTNLVLSNNPNYIQNFFYNGKNKAEINHQFAELCNQFKPDIIHSFDTLSYLTVIILPAFKKHKKVLTLCGGPNSNFKFNRIASHMVLFSNENYNWFKNNWWYRNSSLYLIPQRVKSLELHLEPNPNPPKNTSAFNFVRICRIGHYYYNTIIKSINIIRQFKDKYPVKLYIIGVIENKNLFNELTNIVENEKLPIEFITDDRTIVASKMLYLADAVIGTGRGIMEAMSLEVPVLAYCANHDIPILVNDNNLNQFSDINFSERVIVKEHTINENLKNIERLFTDNDFYNQQSQITNNIFNTHFSVHLAIEKYNKVYQEVLLSRKKESVLKNIIYIRRTRKTFERMAI